MSRGSLGLSQALQAYLLTHGVREHPAQLRLRERTAKIPHAGMQIGAEQGQLMALLVELMGARRVLEIGCFTGYSALTMALALPEGGRLVTLDVNDDWVDIGREAWREAGVEDRIEVRLGLAAESLEALLAEGMAGTFDLAFIDADKKSYDGYYESALQLVRQGGLLLLDNMLWSGAVADPERTDHQTRSLRALAAKILADERVTPALIPIGDGLSAARKR